MMIAAGCNSSSADRPAADFPTIGQPAAINVLEVGAAPLTKLRWAGAKGVNSRVVLAMDTATSVMGQDIKLDMVMDFNARVLDVTDANVHTMEMVVSDASMKMPGMGLGDTGDMFKDMLKGLRIGFDMDAIGNMSNTSVKAGDGAMASMMEKSMGQMNQSMEQMAIPWPSDAVGVGAKWEALTTQTTEHGATVRMVAQYELVEHKDGVGKVAIKIEQYGDEQNIKLETGMSAKLESLKTKGSGSMTFDLSRPMMTDASIKMNMDMEMEVQDMSLDMDIVANVVMKTMGKDAPMPKTIGELINK